MTYPFFLVVCGGGGWGGLGRGHEQVVTKITWTFAFTLSVFPFLFSIVYSVSSYVKPCSSLTNLDTYSLEILGLFPVCQEQDSYWKMMHKYIGSDVTSLVTLPVLIFEPMTMLQKMAEVCAALLLSTFAAFICQIIYVRCLCAVYYCYACNS